MDAKKGVRGGERGSRGRGGERGVGDREAVSEERNKGRGRGGEVRGRRRERVGGSPAQAEGRESVAVGSSETSAGEDKGMEKRGQRGRTGQGQRGGTGLARKGKGDINGGGKMASKGSATGMYLNKRDYLQLLKLLHITLPEGVVTNRAIELSKTDQSIQDAKKVVQNLENFHLDFKATPRLPCRKVKCCLDLKKSGNVLDLTQLVFFEKKENGKKADHKQWEANRSNTGHGFRLKERYMTTPISTPAIYSTTHTRSWKNLEVGSDSPRVTDGVKVNLKDIESRQFKDESALWSTENSSKKFGKNDADEGESLKFFHELGAVTSGNKKVTYSKGNKVEYGFLTGILDFLAQVQNAGLTNREERRGTEKLVIECKSTTGDMVGKLYHKIPKSQKAHVNTDHEYSFQVQTYMYILKKVAEREKSPPTTRAVMVLRHYHEGGQPPRDFHWSFLPINEDMQSQIDGLRAFCQEEVLGCFLAVLNLIFQKEN